MAVDATRQGALTERFPNSEHALSECAPWRCSPEDAGIVALPTPLRPPPRARVCPPNPMNVLSITSLRSAFAAIALLPALAFGQSDALLEAVRLQRPAVLPVAQAELAACTKTSCAKWDGLSLLTGYLMLAEGDAEGAARQLSSRPAPKGLAAYHAFYLGTALF